MLAPTIIFIICIAIDTCLGRLVTKYQMTMTLYERERLYPVIIIFFFGAIASFIVMLIKIIEALFY